MGSIGGGAYDRSCGVPVDQVQFEEGKYSTALKFAPEIMDARRLRDDGWQAFKDGNKDRGLSLLDQSADALSSVSDVFAREVFATDARIAQAYCALGDFAQAADMANKALDNTPKRIKRFEGWNLGFISP